MSVPLITRETMFEPLLVADPSFKLRWDEFKTEWADEPEPPLYLALGSLAEHGRRCLREGSSQYRSSRIFAEPTGRQRPRVYEVWRGSAVALESWLRPETKRWWDKLYRYWDGETGALRFDT